MQSIREYEDFEYDTILRALKGGKKISWDDRKVVREEFQKLDTNQIS